MNEPLEQPEPAGPNGPAAGSGGVWGRLTPRVLTLTAALAVLAALVGVFSTWFATDAGTLNGVQGPDNGWAAVIFGLIALAGVRASARGSWLGVVTLLGCAAVMLWAAFGNLAENDDVLAAGSRWGLWLTVAAALAVVAISLLGAVRRRRLGRSGS